MRNLTSVFLLMLGLNAAQPVIAEEEQAAALEVSGAYVREPIPGRYMSAAFMTLNNTADTDKTLVSVSADWAGIIEIHTHLHDNGVMRMRQLESLTIPAGETVSLQPGGLHLMLFKLQLPLAEPLPLTLCFDDGQCQTVSAELRSLQ